MAIILIILLSGMYFINLLNQWIILCLIIIIPLSIEMIIEPFHKGSDLEKKIIKSIYFNSLFRKNFI